MRSDGLALAATVLLASAIPAGAAEYRAAVLRVDAPGPMPISRLDLPPDDLGFAGGGAGDRRQRHHRRLHGADLRHRCGGGDPETAEAEMQRLLDAGIWWIVTLADEDDDGEARRHGRRQGDRR